MKLAIVRQSLDCRDLNPVRLGGKHGAALYGFPVDMNNTGAALAGVTTHMCSGEAKMIAQQA
jgi:hypothetical protein